MRGRPGGLEVAPSCYEEARCCLRQLRLGWRGLPSHRGARTLQRWSWSSQKCVLGWAAGPQGRHGAGAQRTRPSMTSRLGLCRETTNGSLSVGLRMLETGARSPVSLGLGAGVGGADVLEGEPGARPRRALPGAEGAVGSSARPGEERPPPQEGGARASPPPPVGSFQPLPGLRWSPDSKGGHLQGPARLSAFLHHESAQSSPSWSWAGPEEEATLCCLRAVCARGPCTHTHH